MPKSASTRYRVENRYRPSAEQQPEPEPEPEPEPPQQQHPQQPSEQDEEEEEEEEDAPEPQAGQQKLPPPQRGRRTSMTMATVVSMTQVRQRRINTSFAKSQSQPRVAEAKARTSRTRSQMWLSDNAVEITVSTSATHGQLEFAEGREVLNPAASSLEEARQARFMRVEGDSRGFFELDPQGQLDRAKSLAGLVDFMRHSWGMQMPSVIFAVTGSAEEFELRPKFRDAFMSALLNATRSTNAWIVTGGSDKGIMKLVGDALARGKQMETAIGIAAYSTVLGRTELTADSSAQAELLASMPDCTVRVEVDDPYIYTEEKLNEIYSRHGVVVGVSLSKEGGFLKFLVKKSLSALRANQGAGAGLTPQTSEGASKFALITFRSSEEATHACTNVVRVANQDGHEVELRAKPFEASSTLDTRLYRLHEKKVKGHRGTTRLPYRYTGERDARFEKAQGAKLNPNYSHYLLFDGGLDDGQSAWGSEIAFRSELLDFISFRDDTDKAKTDADLEDLANKLRHRSSGDQRSVPVIGFVYGGGPGTLETCMQHTVGPTSVSPVKKAVWKWPKTKCWSTANVRPSHHRQGQRSLRRLGQHDRLQTNFSRWLRF